MHKFDKRKCLNLISILILVVGLSISAFVYFNAQNETASADGYEFVHGQVYPIHLRDLKRYRRDLEMFGGKAMVLADDFYHWFSSLWKGKRLATTLAVVTIAGSLIGFHLARRQNDSASTDEKPDTLA